MDEREREGGGIELEERRGVGTMHVHRKVTKEEEAELKPGRSLGV